ncbi:hypothetical protein COBT_003660, partial [Conglomerata obtusa]
LTEYFRDVDLKIYMSKYPMYKIGYDISETKDPPIIIVNSNIKQPGTTFNCTGRIEKFGTLYRIKIGPVYLCSKNLKIEP